MPRSRTRKDQQLHQAAWPDMFANLQAAYAELTRAQFDLERRAAELEEARDLFQLVIASLSEALFLMDRTGQIVQVNAAAQALVGRSADQLLGQPFAQVCGTAEVPTTPWELLERSPTGSLYQLEVQLPTMTPGGPGQAVPVLASCGLARDPQGKIVGMLFVARDITERKQAAEALARQAAELARSNTELEQFAYVASHDLQEPLRMMSSFSHLLARRYRGKLDEDADEFIGFIMDGATRMQQLINDLLTYSRVGSKAKILVPTDCTEVLAVARRNLTASIAESGAVVTGEDLPTVLGDETQLVQLFQNLIGNAIKFRVADRPPVVQVGAARQGADWLLWVRDNGIGLDPQYADRIFLIFQRLHTRTEYAGTGIGLAVCKKIVERHGGRIWVESEPGQGSTFYFTLPVQER